MTALWPEGWGQQLAACGEGASESPGRGREELSRQLAVKGVGNGGSWRRAGPQRLCRGARSDAREPGRTAELDSEQSHATAQDTTKGWVSESGQTISLHHSLLLSSLLPWSVPLFSIPCLLAHRPCSEVTVRTWAGPTFGSRRKGKPHCQGASTGGRAWEEQATSAGCRPEEAQLCHRGPVHRSALS